MTLFESLKRYNDKVNFVIAVSDIENFNHKIEDSKIEVVGINQLVEFDKIAEQIYRKYYPQKMDALRWSMKPVLLKYLLNKGNEKAIFLDCDLFFCNKFDFLSQELDSNSVILTAHRRSIVPENKNLEFNRLFNDGFYNAGFIGVNQGGIEALDWWASACAYKCVVQARKGFFVDQGYLSVLPIYFDKVKILEHQGCNIASWNTDYCQRSLDEEGKVKINNKWELVFMHITPPTIRKIKNGKDPLLLPYLEEWKEELEKNRIRFGLPKKKKPSFIQKMTAFILRNFSKLKRLRIVIEG